MPQLHFIISMENLMLFRHTNVCSSGVDCVPGASQACWISAAACRQLREGGRVIGLQEGDTLCFAAQCNDQNVIMVACSEGKVSSYQAQDIPERAGRGAQGVNAKKLKKGNPPS
jgi:hypothetical protein